MCHTFHSYQPVCHCIKVEANVILCSLYSGLPANKDKMKFNAKLITGHSRGLDLLFNGVNYMSAEKVYDLAPNGLDCPEIAPHDEASKHEPCPLCDSPGVLKFLKAKGIEYDPVADIALIDRQAEAAEGSAEDTNESSRGRPLKVSRGESLDKLAGSSTEMEGVEDSASQARKREGQREEGESSGSGLRESKSASMGWD